MGGQAALSRQGDQCQHHERRTGPQHGPGGGGNLRDDYLGGQVVETEQDLDGDQSCSDGVLGLLVHRWPVVGRDKQKRPTMPALGKTVWALS